MFDRDKISFDHDKNLNQRQIDEAILKFLMAYRCTPHSALIRT